MKLQEGYPTQQHQAAAQRIVQHFESNRLVDAVLLYCSCARGKATPDSCLDIAVLVNEGLSDVNRRELEQQWAELKSTSREIAELRKVGRFSEVHLDVVTGEFMPRDQELGGEQDSFELEIGNYIAYSIPLSQNNDHLERLRSKWLPYFSKELRKHRLEMVRANCHNDLQHIPLYVKRRLHFQCLDRLYRAYKEFLQALFIYHSVYPIAYNKWIEEQLVEILQLPALYKELTHLFEIQTFEGNDIERKSEVLYGLLEKHAPRVE